MLVADLESARAGAEQAVESIARAGGQAEFFPCDVAGSYDNEALVAYAGDRGQPARHIPGDEALDPADDRRPGVFESSAG